MMAGFNPADFTAPKAKPLPVVLLLDVSSSMGGASIQMLNEATKTMIEDFAKAEKSEIEILVSIITFGAGVKLELPFTSASEVEWQDLSVSGATPMGTAFSMVKSMIEDKQVTPSRAYKPTLVLVSDGAPTDSWETSLGELVNEGRSSKCDRMAMAIGTGTDNNVLNKFIANTEHKVFQASDATEIQNFFKFVTMSVTTRTNSQTPNQIPVDDDLPSHSSVVNEEEDDDDDEF